MRVELTQVHWLDRHHELTLAELAELSGLSETELHELVDAGALVPIDADVRPWIFHAHTIAVARTAYRMRKDFELDTPSLALALGLLDRIRDLEAQLTELRAQLPRIR